jgi:hypothetical protein
MKETKIPGVFNEKNRLFTENYCKGIQVYNEKLVKFEGKEYRSWNPYRSKLAAAILKGLKNIKIKSDSKVLYLGAATGTTVSHISVYWLCFSPTFDASATVVKLSNFIASFPVIQTLLMCETSKRPTDLLTVKCSSRIDEYWMGISKPANSVNFAPSFS